MNSPGPHPPDPDGASPPSTETDVPGPQRAVDRAGPYQLIHLLGEGGMGEVWLAEQRDPVRRQVAVKIVKHGLDTKQVLARFEAERQALALMDHPCVAKVFDAGTTAQGRPYFVMEHIQGLSITEHCDRSRLTTRERLELFRLVCDGVQHAHQKAILHRDIKPSNVLVALQDGKPAPKIIDFGVAKATAQRLTERTLFTELGVLIGTPEYMSPEQAELTAQDVDTRTDVYSLGVLLYELLVGALPFDPRALRQAGLQAILRRIREEEPPKPSARLGTLGGEVSAESARRRRVDVPTLRKQLSGDLDWIAMKAMEKQRARRYGSAAELAADIERHLTHQPVVARPPGAAYRAGKFVRRHRLGVGGAASAVLMLLAFLGALAWQAGHIARERDRANREARTANQALTFLTDLFEVSDPSRALGRDTTAREMLDRGARKLETELAGEPETQARLFHTIGEVYAKLGLYSEAQPLIERSLSLFRRLFGEDHPETLRAMNDVGFLLKVRGKLDEAEPYYREALARSRHVLGNEHPDTLNSISNLALLLQKKGRLGEAEPFLREVVEANRRVLGAEDPQTLLSLNNLGLLFQGQGRLEDADPLLREALEGRRRVLGEDDPATLESVANVGSLLLTRGELDEAEPYYRRALEGRRRVLGKDHPMTLSSVNNMGSLLRAQGKLGEAEEYFREALETRRRLLGADHSDTLRSMYNLAALLQSRGRLEEAQVLLAESVAGYRRILGSEHYETLRTIHGMGNLLLARGKAEEAERYCTEAMNGARHSLGKDHPDTLLYTASLGDVHAGLGRFAEAERLLLEAATGVKRALPAGHPVAGSVFRSYGRYLLGRKRCAEAEEALLTAHGILETANRGLALDTARDLVKLYTACGEPTKAAEWQAKAASMTQGKAP